MSLLLNIKENSVFFVGDVKCFVKNVRDKSTTVVVPFLGSKEFTLLKDQSEEVLPHVFASLDSVIKDKGLQIAKLSIEAPKYVNILKPDVYYKLQEFKKERKTW